MLVNPGDLFLVAAGFDFKRQFLGQQLGERLADGFIAANADELFHLAVPGFDGAMEIDREHAHGQ